MMIHSDAIFKINYYVSSSNGNKWQALRLLLVSANNNFHRLRKREKPKGLTHYIFAKISDALRVHMLKSAPYLPHTFLLKIRIVPHRELFF